MNTTQLKTWTMYPEGSQALDVIFKITPDPTGAIPAFGLTLVDEDTPPTDWKYGAWRTPITWNSRTGLITATSALIGGTPSELLIEADTKYMLWYKIGVGSESFPGRCAIINSP